MTFQIREADLERLETLTKYPSIETYHPLDPTNGRLLDGPLPFSGPVVLTEKVDGTNARIAHLPDGTVLVGSRNEWLHALGDVVANPALGIVAAVRPLAERIAAGPAPPPDTAVVYFGEVYGGKVTGASAQYTGERRVGYRLFDVARIGGLAGLLALPPDELARWRDGGGQPFETEDELPATAERVGVALTPRVGVLDASDLPQGLLDAEAFLAHYLPDTRVALDGGAGGRAEGLVLRTPTRSTTAKARFQDYHRTLHKGGGGRR